MAAFLICLNTFLSFGQVNRRRVDRQMDLPTSLQAWEFVKALFFPFVTLHQVLAATYPRNKCTNLAAVVSYMLLFFTWASLFISYYFFSGVFGWAWSALFTNSIILCTSTSPKRFPCAIQYPFKLLGGLDLFTFHVLSQLRIQCLELGLPVKEYDDDDDEEVDNGEIIVDDENTISEKLPTTKNDNPDVFTATQEHKDHEVVGSMMKIPLAGDGDGDDNDDTPSPRQCNRNSQDLGPPRRQASNDAHSGLVVPTRLMSRI